MTDQPDSREVEVTQADRANEIAFGIWSDAFRAWDRERQPIKANFDAADVIAAALATTADRVAVLEAALRAIVEGNVPRPVGMVYRRDGKRSKHDQCTHRISMYDDCGNCIADFATTALAPVDLPRLDLAKD